MAKRGQALRRSRAIKRPAKSAVDLKQEIAALKRELAQEREQRAATHRDLEQSLDRQTATSDILRAIAASPGEAEGTLRKIAETTARLFSAAGVSIRVVEGDEFKLSVGVGRGAKQVTALYEDPATRPTPGDRRSLPAAVVRENRQIQLRDLDNLDPEMADWPGPPVARAAGIRTMIGTPLRSEGRAIGAMTVYRDELRPFDEVELQLLQSFADQAVIAIENTRLLTEQREALEQQTATAEVLQVINSSPGALAPVFEAMLEKATRLCEAGFGVLWLYEGERFRLGAAHAVPAAFVEFSREPVAVEASASLVGIAHGGSFVHIADAAASEAYLAGNPLRRAAVDLGGARTLLSVPLRKDGALLGAFTIYRKEVRPFSDKQIALVQNFAAQAVIAIENARLITETREALEQQTATAEVLQVINSSPGNLAPVLDAMLEKAMSLCEAAFGHITTFDGELFHHIAARGNSDLVAFFHQTPALRASTDSITLARVIAGQSLVHVPDCRDTDEYRERPVARGIADRGGMRTLLTVALRKEDTLLGTIHVYRQEVRPFSEKQIALLQNFAAQAVIAMENARLITETREALERQTATAEVLQVINSSPGDLAPVFDAILEKAHRLCGVAQGSLQLYDGKGCYRAVAVRGLSAAWADRLRQGFTLSPNAPGQRLLEGGRFVQMPDLAEKDDPIARAAVELGGIRTALFIPLRKDSTLLGRITATRQEVKPFTEKEIALLESFAAQAVIAMENARLLDEVRHRNDELAEALEFQTATGEVLRIVASSPDHLQPVFDAMVEKATELCEAKFGTLFLYDGTAFTIVADRNLPPAYVEAVRGQSISPETNTGFRHLVESKAPFHIKDMFADGSYAAREPLRVAAVDLGGVRSAVVVPLLKKGELIGSFSIYREASGGFAENQIALVTTFADQAVIAIENARLFGELHQRTTELARSVDELTATGDVLKIISRSFVELETVLDTLVETVARLCRADQAYMYRRRDDEYHMVAARGLSGASKEFVRTHPLALDRGTVAGRVGLDRGAVHIPDVLEDPEYTYREGQKIAGFRTLLGIPLLREDTLVGIFGIGRRRVEPFTDKEIELATSFADQAVIAIENARLFEELRERQVELARSVDELTATGDVLKIISRSSVDLETVLDTLVETVARLCGVDQAVMLRRRDNMYHLVAACGFSEEAKEFVLAHPFAPNRGTIVGRVILERRAVHITDVLQDPEYTYKEGQKIVGFRTMLGIPLLRGDELVGIFTLHRTRVESFTQKEIELATTFADQAVIAIENARLFEELRDRQAELRVTFDNMGDGVVMFDAEARLTAWNRNFQEMLDLPDAFLAQRPSLAEYFRYLVERGEYSADLEAELSRTVDDATREMRYERTRPDGRVIEVRRNPVPGGGFVVIFSDITERKRAEAAINAARDAAEGALRELQTAQASLVHAQKMAALGQLTAGIAHEIKNPLNFVNNFAGLSVELLDELKEASAQAMGTLDADKRAEIVETIGMLTSNLEKIAEHGRRADGIVKSMLQHSRGGSGDWQSSDLNELVEEALNLAYHGARAQDQSFNITMERDLDQSLAPIEVVPQDVMRVFLNLIGNGFYAANKRSHDSDGAYRPVLKITTRAVGDAVEIVVRDNGVGIPAEHREKLFQPFFTTKPTGEGTGLGLSISFDIVTQQHGGTITVESELGQFTEFTVRLPRRRHLAAGRVA